MLKTTKSILKNPKKHTKMYYYEKEIVFIIMSFLYDYDASMIYGLNTANIYIYNIILNFCILLFAKKLPIAFIYYTSHEFVSNTILRIKIYGVFL